MRNALEWFQTTRRRKRSMLGIFIAVLAASLFLGQASAQQVAIEKSGFNNIPDKFFYFKDSDVVLWLDANEHVLWRSENHGKHWDQVSDIPSDGATYLFEHPHDKDKAYVLSKGKTHWKSNDKGKSWQSFETPVEPAVSNQLSFHAERPNYVLFLGFKCKLGGWTGVDCADETYYTLNNFEEVTLLRTHTSSCIWSLSSPEFENAPVKEVMCVESPEKAGLSSLFNPENFQLVQSEDFFRTTQPVNFGTGTEVHGVIAVSAVNRFLVAAAKPSAADPTMDLYVSQDGENWHEAVFPEGASVQEKAYTIVESTGQSLLVDVLVNPLAEFGTLYKSNSNGTFFVNSLNHTNRNGMGIVDFERMQGVEGVMLANVVANHEQVAAGSAKKELQTRISFDDGSTWTAIKKVKNPDGTELLCSEDECALHMHSVTEMHNSGEVYSSDAAVGVAMGVGHYGRSLLEYDECDTFLSADGGLTWVMVREGAHKYEFGDMGALLVMVDDEKEVDHVWWSKNRGSTWEKLDLGMNVRARMLTTDPESTSRNFLLIGSSRGAESHVQAIHLDFTTVQSRQCELKEHDDEKSDFEKWYARDLTQGPDCLMGHEQMFYRRKADRDCYVGRDYQDPVMEMKECPCSEADYECDYNFVRGADGKCVRIGPDRLVDGTCESKDATYPASSGYRLIPGNTCNQQTGTKLDEPVDRSCSENQVSPDGPLPPAASRPPNPLAEPSDENIKRYPTAFSDEIDQFMYFEDSPAMILRLRNGEVWRSEQHGIQWTRVLENAGPASIITLHEFDNTRAYALLENEIQVTNDQGASWQRMQVPRPPSRHVAQVLDFHPQEKDWLLFVGEAENSPYHAEAFISRDHGGRWDSLNMWVDKCIFGRDSKYSIQKETIYCSGYDEQQISEDAKLMRTIDWGQSKEVLFDNIVEFFVIEDFMAVAASHGGNLALYVSIDGQTFAEAQFPPNQYIDRNTFTVLQSTTHAILLNIFKAVGAGRAHGALYKSNDNGTFYHMSLDNTNGDMLGFVDFEKMQGVDGIILANQVMNADELVGNRGVAKRVRTMISWDDGGQWQPLTAPHEFDCTARDCTLNLHSRTDIHGPGAIFTAGGAPGLAMGVGNVGPELLPYEQSDTFLTRDGGHTWQRIQNGEHLYEFGDHGSLLVLINDEGPTNELLYSWDQGETWHFYQFAQTSVKVNALTTDPMSTTLKFIILGHTKEGQRSQVLITVDFSEVSQRKCELDKGNQEKSDFEPWIAKDDDGDDACLLGKRTAYLRRKKDRVCIVGEAFKEAEVIEENCECRDIDYECDFGFWRNEQGECQFYGRHPDRPAKCGKNEQFIGRSGYKKNPKSTCTAGVDLEKEKTWPCGEGGQIQSSRMEFTDRILDYVYFTDTDRVIVRTADGKVWGSENDGYSWSELFPSSNIIAIYQNPHFEDRAYFITDGLVHYATQDKGSNFEEMSVPLVPVMNIQGNVMNFHNVEADYLLYLGEKDCDTSLSMDCHSEAFYSHDNGKSWNHIGTYLRNCIWGREGSVEKADHHAILCEQYHEKSGNQRSFFGNQIQYVTSTDYFSDKQVIFEDIAGIAVFGKYIVVAVANGASSNLRLYISLDGVTFASASLPAGFDLPPEAFTIMESVNSLWVHVSTNTHRGSEYGNIFTSNSNGTYYVMSLENANRNELGIVDFEKMQGIEGIAIANRVNNPGEANAGNPKKLVTMLTADAGGHWNPLHAPEKDSSGKSYDCGKDCQLHLHCYSERRNARDLFSLSSAVGLMVGVGNVGNNLAPYRDGNMFLTRDAGKTWNEIQKGSHIWEFADQGALLILVDDKEPTNYVKYTTNEGMSWNEYQFADKNAKIQVEDIITQPDGTSQKYVLFGQDRDSGKTVAYHIDFSAIHPTKCKLDLNNPEHDDFELWSPEDTRGETCLFGRETKYYRRIQNRDCYIGERLVQPREEVRNCECTEEDFECDFNFVRDENNKCVLVPGLQPLKPECHGSMDYYFESTGYRKTAATSCQGGLSLDEGEKYWCPGKSTGGGMWAVYILTPIAGAGLIYGCLHYRKHGGRIGQIHLPDGSTGGGAHASRLLSNPVVTKVAAAAVVIPIAIIGLLSRIPIPHSLEELKGMLPSWPSRNRGYSPLGQDEHATDVLLDDYDGSEGQLLDDMDEDADEL
ncbi:hypothetical protein BDB00DRAFT_849759 [Zychaea mexicana]|uniref:uncharacterized protein n=1 Tax=Zychaea mexicana TaxID=64656 RepID=UPI0022FF01BF|nr:uncharacterized protein BDB00DRAFT_849759 [Zychaea mexicana]KAI9488126.1 hypothetical protein BDB00DRAFT_849759 [Zychaea mexicana]